MEKKEFDKKIKEIRRFNEVIVKKNGNTKRYKRYISSVEKLLLELAWPILNGEYEEVYIKFEDKKIEKEEKNLKKIEKEEKNLKKVEKSYEDYYKEFLVNKENEMAIMRRNLEELFGKEINPSNVYTFQEKVKKLALYKVIDHYGSKRDLNALLGKVRAEVKSFSGQYDDYHQKIFVGAPGVGKSHSINIETESVPELYKTRIVFHPDYENHDFVGSILPVVNKGNVTYEFKPGPFTRCLMQAHKNPKIDHYLIIEEITRGNASAIFGEVFQLLDRNENGVSKYPINNEDMAKAIYGSEAKKGNYQVVIPKNVSILATANTSDQNVFVLDTAFKRRFEFEYLDVEDVEKSKLPEIEIFGESWKDIYMIFNNFIVDVLEMEEDKQIGPFFIQKQDEIAKLCRYLWEDIDKANYMDGKSIFSSEYGKRFASINKLCNEGMLIGNGKNKEVLSKEFFNYLNNNMKENISSDSNGE